MVDFHGIAIIKNRKHQTKAIQPIAALRLTFSLWCIMTRKQRLRRAGILSCHCLRNLAFYKAGWQDGKLIFKDQFWVNANGNFLKICVMEWCKLFGDVSGAHYWAKVISQPKDFFNGLLQGINITETEFNAYIKEMRTYRDKFIAHLDSDMIMHIPKLDVARKSAAYLYDYLLAKEDEGDFFLDAPSKASTFYQRFLKEGKSVYDE